MSSKPASPISAATPIRFSDPPPAEVDIVVIGGGIIGITAALYLNRLGLRTYVVEKGRVAGEQSSRIGAGFVNWAVTRRNYQ